MYPWSYTNINASHPHLNIWKTSNLFQVSQEIPKDVLPPLFESLPQAFWGRLSQNTHFYKGPKKGGPESHWATLGGRQFQILMSKWSQVSFTSTTNTPPNGWTLSINTPYSRHNASKFPWDHCPWFCFHPACSLSPQTHSLQLPSPSLTQLSLAGKWER